MPKTPMTPEERKARKAKNDRQYRLKNAAKIAHRQADWAKKNETRLKVKRHNDYVADRERRLAKEKEKYAANPAPKRAQSTAWRMAHPEWKKQNDKRYVENNREKVRENQARWRAEHQDELAAYRAAHPEQPRANAKRHRALTRGASHSDLSHEQWLEIQVAQDHCCAHCHKRCKGRLTQDHITPVTKGGPHTLHNVIAVCRNCNSKKGTKPSPVFVQPLLLTVAPSKP